MTVDRRQPRLLLFCSRLNTGGAERQFRLFAEAAARSCEVLVVSVWGEGRFWIELQKANKVKTLALGSRKPLTRISKAFALVGLIRHLRAVIIDYNPDRLYSILFFNNLISYLATPAEMRDCLVWGMRTSGATSGLLDRLCRYICRALSKSVPLVIANSRSGRDFLRSFGFKNDRIEVVNNGIDHSEFRVDGGDRRHFRQQYQFSKEDILVGIVGRLDPLKGHETFIEAARLCQLETSRLRFLFVGGGRDAYSQNILRSAQSILTPKSFLWLEECNSLREVYNGLDILVSCSVYEGFSNVVAEAMACGKCCIVTDVGDSALIVGQSDFVVGVGDARSIASKLLKAAGSMTDGIVNEAPWRERIVSCYSVETMVKKSIGAMFPEDSEEYFRDRH